MPRAQGRIRMQLRTKGFSLVELMVVVVIIGVLAVVAGSAYRRYSDAGRTAEVMSMIGEFRAKEEAYRAEFNGYCNTQTNCTTTALETVFYPALGTCAAGSVEPCPKVLTTPPAAWTTMGINPQRKQLYCGYVVVAGAAGTAVSVAGDGQNLLGMATLTVPWYYIHASCDNKSTNPLNTTYTTAMSSTAVVTKNEHY
jgi:prepilin-type N-terminal cleavage/methylation domain-containing protein